MTDGSGFRAVVAFMTVTFGIIGATFGPSGAVAGVFTGLLLAGLITSVEPHPAEEGPHQ